MRETPARELNVRSNGVAARMPKSPDLDRQLRLDEAKTAERIGGVPPPATIKGAVKTVVKAPAGDEATVLRPSSSPACSLALGTLGLLAAPDKKR